MPVPETTSAEAFERYVGGKCLRVGSGEAWRDIKAWTVALPHIVDVLHLPSVSEPFLAWNISGEVEFQERESKGPWITQRLTKGSFFLTSGGAPYDCRWKAVTPEPFESMAVFIALPLLQRAMEEVFGDDAVHAQLRSISAFTDVALNSLMERVHEELMRRAGWNSKRSSRCEHAVKLLRRAGNGFHPKPGGVRRRDRGAQLKQPGNIGRAQHLIKPPGSGGPGNCRR